MSISIRMIFKCALSIGLAGFCLSGCADVTNRWTEPKIIQGAPLEAKRFAELHLGMNKAEIQAILGTPVLTDPLNPHRWHYLFLEQRGQKNLQKQGITLWFEQGRLTRIEKI